MFDFESEGFVFVRVGYGGCKESVTWDGLKPGHLAAGEVLLPAQVLLPRLLSPRVVPADLQSAGDCVSVVRCSRYSLLIKPAVRGGCLPLVSWVVGCEYMLQCYMVYDTVAAG